MNLTYNGIKLEICHFNDFQENDLYSEDGVDYLYTHFVVDVTCVFNQGATASFGGAIQAPPDGVAGDPPTISVKTLRQALLMPAQILFVDVGGTILLASPPTFVFGAISSRAPCDANNGPRPTHCNVTEFSGIQTMIVRFRIETWLNQRTPKPSLKAQTCLLSNRWTVTENIREDFTALVHCEGQAVFRMDFFAWIKANFPLGNAAFPLTKPDALRLFIVPTPRNGFQRRNLVASLSSDGTRLSWSFDDEQQIYMLDPAAGIWKVEGYTFSDLNWTGGLLGIPGLRLPEAMSGIHAEVWGRPAASRQTLANALVRIMTAIGVPINDRVPLRARMQIDFPHRHGSVDITLVINGIVGGAINALFAASLADLPNLNLFQDFDTPNLWTQGAPKAVIQPGTEGKTGDFASALLAQTFYVPSVDLTAQPPTPIT